MSAVRPHYGMLRLVLVLMLLTAALSLAGCSAQKADSGSSSDTPAEEPATAEKESAEPQGYDSWIVYVNDDDSYVEGGITYSIALNLTATNPTQDAAGTYTGTATASTSTTGETGGHQLNASAIANSSKLEFTLEEGFDSADGALAPVTEAEQVFSGTGSIVMEAAGSGTIDGAGGAFSNTSGQNLSVNTQGSAVTLSVTISGHTYTFEGTIRGE